MSAMIHPEAVTPNLLLPNERNVLEHNIGNKSNVP